MNAARTAVVRWSWRMFRRDWRQQVLVLALVTVAVTAAVAGTAMVVKGMDASHGLGGANALVRVDTGDERADATVEAVEARYGVVDVIGHRSVAVPGFSERLDLRTQDPDGPFGASLLAVRDGRYPTGDDEIALSHRVAGLLDVGLGDTVTADGRTWTVVGEVENPSSLSDVFGLVAPSGQGSAETLQLLLDTDSARPVAAGASAGDLPVPIEQLGGDAGAVATLVLIVLTLVMSLTALIAAAGFVVVAQRRQRQLGLLAAIGATERHVRLSMIANGVIVGVTAALVGTPLGLAVWWLAAPAVEEAAGHRIDRLDLPWGLLATCVVLAVVASTVAAWWPARTVARMPVVSALARRPSPPVPVHRSLGLAAVLLVTGVGAIAAARPLSDVRPLVLIAGLLAVIVGVVLVAPAAIKAVAAAAPRLPLAPRLALRDLARYQSRAAGTLGAIALALGVCVTLIVLAKASEVGPGEGNLSDRQLLIHADRFSDGGDLDAVAEEAAAAVGGARVLPLDRAGNGTVTDPRGLVDLAEPVDDGFRHIDEPYVATPEVLAHFGVDADRIRSGSELLSSLDGEGDLVLLDPTVRVNDGERLAVQPAPLSGYADAPQSLITPAAMAAHGWRPVRAAWLLEADHPLTAREVGAARDIAAGHDLSVEQRWDQDALLAIRTTATTVGVLLTLAIVAMAITLLRGESAQDVRTLTATGARARTRRALTASTAGALAALGAGLSVVGAYLAMVAGFHADLGRLVPLPVLDLSAIVVGLPLAAGLVGWVLGGGEPPSTTRQAFD